MATLGEALSVHVELVYGSQRHRQPLLFFAVLYYPSI
jgi:hypothetical protein